MTKIRFNKSLIREVVIMSERPNGLIWIMLQTTNTSTKLGFIVKILNYMQNVNGKFMENNTVEYKVDVLHKVLNNNKTLRETVENYNSKVTPSIEIPK